MRIIKNIDDEFISKTTNNLVFYVGDILNSLEINLGDEDYVLMENRRAVVSIDKNNKFITENNKECVEILIAKRILSLRFYSPLSDILADREIVRIGLSKKLFYYYYILLSSPRKIKNIEDFLQINIPWISFYPYNKNYSEYLKDLLHSFDYQKEFESSAEKLFSLLKKNLYTDKAIKEAEAEWLLCR